MNAPMNPPIIIGAGLAGLMTALHLARRCGPAGAAGKVFVLSPALPGTARSGAMAGTETASAWAQGGLAAAVGADDSVEQHAADTIAAGDGLCDPDAVRRIVSAGPAVVERLVQLGVRFDRDAAGRLRPGLEAAHTRRRIVHAAGDGTGREIMRALLAAVSATPSITLLHGVTARRLLLDEGGVVGVQAESGGRGLILPGTRVVIATGGIGALFQHSTNPRFSAGQGLALAARAGARLSDLEFVQFHPTALDAGGSPMRLVSEAVRGEGALLVDETGRRFLPEGGELLPRDQLTRAVWRHGQAGHRVFLDARGIADFPARFPAITGFCAATGIDPRREPIPVRPAAHYHMGGIAVDAAGRSSVPGLWACGEAACTGLHGANRLASNSLLEAAVCAMAVAEDLAGTPARPGRPVAEPPGTGLPPLADPAPVRAILSAAAGVARDGAGLTAAARQLLPLAGRSDAAAVALMIVIAAWRRTESRGAHHRSDHPGRHASPVRSSITLDEALNEALDEASHAARALPHTEPRLARSA